MLFYCIAGIAAMGIMIPGPESGAKTGTKPYTGPENLILI